MAIFKRNLTSKILEEQSSIIISKKKTPISILEVGCGNGNISLNLAKNFPNNNYSASDISDEAISQAKSLDNTSVNFSVGSGIDYWLDQKFDLVICDISAISEELANLSDWYNGISCNTGQDGLDVVKPVIQNVKNILNPGGIFLMPIISLCNVLLQKEMLRIAFSSIKYSKKVDWPLPKNLLVSMDKKGIDLNSNYINIERKFDIIVASTYTAICYL
jgi:methylase of polypeptide subunit release factors